MGKRTSVYLTGDREAAVTASGKTILDLIDLGLEVIQRMDGGLERQDAQAARDGRAPIARNRREREESCKHPPARRAKGLCMACGTYVG